MGPSFGHLSHEAYGISLLSLCCYDERMKLMTKTIEKEEAVDDVDARPSSIELKEVKLLRGMFTGWGPKISGS